MEEPFEFPGMKKLLRNFLIELGIYATLVVAYFYLVLRLLGDYLAELFDSNKLFYAVLALFLIVMQGVLFEALTSFLLDQIKLERLE